MTNNQVKACAIIFAICRKAIDKKNTTDISNAQRFPLKLMTQYVSELHQRRLATEELEKKIAELMGEIDLEVMKEEFDKCLPMEQQSLWMMTYVQENGII